MTPEQRRRCPLVYAVRLHAPAGDRSATLLHPAPLRGSYADLLGEWIRWLGDNQATWNAPEPPRTWHLLLGVTAEHRLVDYWWLSGQFRRRGDTLEPVPGPADAPTVVVHRPDGPHLLAAWKLALSAGPGDRVLLDDELHAARVVAHIRRLTGGGYDVRVSREGNRWQVLGPGEQPLVVTVASWLALHDWPEPTEPPATQPADVDLVPIAPTEP